MVELAFSFIGILIMAVVVYFLSESYKVSRQKKAIHPVDGYIYVIVLIATGLQAALIPDAAFVVGATIVVLCSAFTLFICYLSVKGMRTYTVYYETIITMTLLVFTIVTVVCYLIRYLH